MKTAASKFFILKKGFTLIEIMISMTIIGLVFTTGLAKYMDFNKTQTLKSAALDFKNNLRDIQAKANAGVKPTDCVNLTGYIVQYFSVKEYQVYAACDSNILTKTYTLNSGTEFLSDFGSFTFYTLSQGVSDVPTITIKSTTVDKTVDLIITSGGEIKDDILISATGATVSPAPSATLFPSPTPCVTTGSSCYSGSTCCDSVGGVSCNGGICQIPSSCFALGENCRGPEDCCYGFCNGLGVCGIDESCVYPDSNPHYVLQGDDSCAIEYSCGSTSQACQ